MAKVPSKVGKKVTKGNRVRRRGLPKKTGGIGLNTTGKSRRQFRTNMQRKKVRCSDGTVRRMWVRAKDLKSGKYDNPSKEQLAGKKAS